MNDFNKALENAQQLPSTDESSNPTIPDPFASGDMDRAIAAMTTGEEEGEVPGIVKTSMEFHCARLQIGASERGFEHGQMQMEEADDSERLKEIMDQSLTGKAVIMNKQQTFLRTGGIVIWLEWMTYVEPPAKEERDYMTESELLSPESSDKDSDNPESTEP